METKATIRSVLISAGRPLYLHELEKDFQVIKSGLVNSLAFLTSKIF